MHLKAHQYNVPYNVFRKLNCNRQTLRKPSSNKVPVRGKSLIKMKLRERKQDLKVSTVLT